MQSFEELQKKHLTRLFRANGSSGGKIKSILAKLFEEADIPASVRKQLNTDLHNVIDEYERTVLDETHDFIHAVKTFIEVIAPGEEQWLGMFGKLLQNDQVVEYLKAIVDLRLEELYAASNSNPGSAEEHEDTPATTG